MPAITADIRLSLVSPVCLICHIAALFRCTNRVGSHLTGQFVPGSLHLLDNTATDKAILGFVQTIIIVFNHLTLRHYGLSFKSAVHEKATVNMIYFNISYK